MFVDVFYVQCIHSFREHVYFVCHFIEFQLKLEIYALH